MSTPRVTAIHDMSGFGRCSLTVALPILSAMGVQCCPLPTAFLSTHTGGFEGFTFLDMTDEMPKIARHWKSLGLRFDAVYSGFLGSARQIGMVADFIRDFRGDGVVVVDPVMGDGGAVYRTYTPEMCAGTARLAEQADVITPNLTEAALLLGIPYGELPGGEAGCRAIVERLSLEVAIRKMVTDMSQVSDVSIYFETDEKHLKFDEDEENAIYRVIQESITNAVRHGKAEKIWITLKRVDGEILLVIKDNGTGAKKMESGFGTRHIRERIEMLKGTVDFDGQHGFTVTAHIPIRWGETYD